MNEHQRSPQATNTPAQLPLVAPELLLAAIDALPKWDKVNVSKVTWVNWRQGFQIKMGWHSGAALQCYVDFGRDSVARDCVLARAFHAYAPTGQQPGIIDGHGWTKLNYTFHSKNFISVNEVAAIATEMGYEFTVIYVQEDISARPVFDLMGIPLVPGEMGKEWVNGQFVAYSRTGYQCL